MFIAKWDADLIHVLTSLIILINSDGLRKVESFFAFCFPRLLILSAFCPP